MKSLYVVRPDQIPRRVLRERRRGERMDVRALPGFDIRVDTSEQIGWAIARSGVYEPLVTEVMWRLAQPSDLAFDVGANIGYFTGLLSRRVSRTVAVEAHPAIAQILAANAARWRAVDVIASAVSDHRGSATLSVPPGSEVNHGEASLEGHVDAEMRFNVETITLDELLGGRSVGIMKLDIEGHELSALNGAAHALADGRIRNLFFEDHEPLPSAVSTLLSDVGFSVFSLVEHRRGVSLGPIDAPPPKWYAPTYLATLSPERAQRMIRPNGWHCLRPRPH